MVQKELKPLPQKENLNSKENKMIEISDQELEKKNIKVHGKNMAYVEKGEGDPIIFQHGNPTSSYLWRNIIPYLENQGRCIACLLYTSPSPRDATLSRMPSSA